MYAALRLQAVQWRVIRPPCASSVLDRSGTRSTSTEPQEGQTRGFWSRSAAIRISASGARYSLMPRRPTVGPSGGAWWHGSGCPTQSEFRATCAPAKGGSHSDQQGALMPSFLRTSIYSLALLISSTHIAAGQRVHQIKLDANP